MSLFVETPSNSDLQRKPELVKSADTIKNDGPVESRVRVSASVSQRGEGDSDTRTEVSSEHASVVAAHYNTLEERGLKDRLNSRIFHMRNFNNWIKSVLINEYMDLVKAASRHGVPLKVLDMCCGKGGDLFKWRKASINHLICADIASVSVEQCQSRYNDLVKRSATERNQSALFTAEFISADCTKERLREKYRDASVEIDLVSCQFAFHYCFESLPQAECMLQNAAECLRPGGFFIGTIPDAFDIVSRAKKIGGSKFGNDLFNIEFSFECENGYPLFGAMYNFHLEGVVDCPEFLVHFPTFIELAKKFGLELISKERFVDYYEKKKEDGKTLFSKMQCFETYPPFPKKHLSSTVKNDYLHADAYLSKSVQSESDQIERINTLSKSEWEAISIYTIFAFRKLKTTWDSEGKPVFEPLHT